MITFKQINIERRPYCLFNDMINIKNSDSNLLNIGKISFKSTGAVIYSIKSYHDHVNIDSENSLCLIFDNKDGYIEESSESKYCSLLVQTRQINIRKVHRTMR